MSTTFLSGRFLAVAFAGTLSTTTALAQAPAPAAAPAGGGFKPVLGALVTSGGDTLVTVRYTDGTSQNIKSGGLLGLFGGVEYDSGTMVVQATIGYHVDDTNASNGSVKFVRYPVELLGFWKASEQWRVGGGFRKAMNARVTSSGAARPGIGGTDFDSKAGLVLQAEYLFDRWSVFGRYVAEEYTVGRQTVDANHIGLGVSFRF
jgi:hypothetical protein